MKITPTVEASIEFNDTERKYLFEYIRMVEKIDSWLNPGDDMYKDLQRIIFETESFKYLPNEGSYFLSDESYDVFIVNDKSRTWNERKVDLNRFKKYLASKGYTNGKQYHFIRKGD